MKVLIACEESQTVCKAFREWARTCNMSLLSARNEVAKELAAQAYGKKNVWSAFVEFMSAIVGVYALHPECSDEEICELFRALKFEVVNDGTT